MPDEDREEEGLVGEWKVGLLRRDVPVLSDRAVPASAAVRVTADRVVLRGLAAMVGKTRVMTVVSRSGIWGRRTSSQYNLGGTRLEGGSEKQGW